MAFTPRDWEQHLDSGQAPDARDLIALEQRVYEAAVADASGGEGGAVLSVNGATGVVVLDAEDVGALPDSTRLLQLGTSSSTALRGDTALLALGTSSSTALRGDYAPPADQAAGTSSARRLGTGSTEAAPGASAIGRAAHGATPGTTRPTGYALVVWIGSVEPTNRATGDLWVRTA